MTNGIAEIGGRSGGEKPNVARFKAIRSVLKFNGRNDVAATGRG